MKLGLLALLVCSLSFAATDAEVAGKVTAALQTPTVPTAEWWKELGPRGKRALISQLQEPISIQMKTRAVEALRFYDDAEAGAILKHQAESASNPTLRRMAARSLILARGLKEKAFIEELLRNRDPNMRFRAAQALQTLHTSESEKMVQDFLAREEIPWVIQKVQASQKQTSGAEARRAKPAGIDPRQ